MSKKANAKLIVPKTVKDLDLDALVNTLHPNVDKLHSMLTSNISLG